MKQKAKKLYLLISKSYPKYQASSLDMMKAVEDAKQQQYYFT